jgi:hypothetical protein
MVASHVWRASKREQILSGRERLNLATRRHGPNGARNETPGGTEILGALG